MALVVAGVCGCRGCRRDRDDGAMMRLLGTVAWYIAVVVVAALMVQSLAAFTHLLWPQFIPPPLYVISFYVNIVVFIRVLWQALDYIDKEMERRR
jgi:hypothetical protein